MTYFFIFLITIRISFDLKSKSYHDNITNSTRNLTIFYYLKIILEAYHYDHQSISFLILSILMLYIVELFKKKLFFFSKIKLADISASAGAV